MVFEGLKEVGLTAGSWLVDKGNNTWWTHGGGIHPAMPGDTTPILKIAGSPNWASVLGQKSKTGVDAGLQCPMCSTKSDNTL